MADEQLRMAVAYMGLPGMDFTQDQLRAAFQTHARRLHPANPQTGSPEAFEFLVDMYRSLHAFCVLEEGARGQQQGGGNNTKFDNSAFNAFFDANKGSVTDGSDRGYGHLMAQSKPLEREDPVIDRTCVTVDAMNKAFESLPCDDVRYDAEPLCAGSLQYMELGVEPADFSSLGGAVPFVDYSRAHACRSLAGMKEVGLTKQRRARTLEELESLRDAMRYTPADEAEYARMKSTEEGIEMKRIEGVISQDRLLADQHKMRTEALSGWMPRIMAGGPAGGRKRA